MIKNMVYRLFLFFGLFFVFLIPSNLFAQISVECFGGAGRVSGSCALLKVDNDSYIIDCGSFYEEYDLPLDNSVIDKKILKAKAMILTHAHNDHSGKILLLINEGFNGPIYCTDATKKILLEVLNDGWNYQDIKHKYFWSQNKKKNIEKYNKGYLTLHWFNDCKKNVKNIERSKELCSMKQLQSTLRMNVSVCKKCLDKELEKIESQFKTINYKENIDLTKDINFYLYDAGHITGSASVLFNIYNLGKITTVVFSGDLGSGFSKITPNKDIIPKVDYVFVETTYGGISKNIGVDDYNKFQQTISNALNNNKIVWIPALSLHRTQKILYEIKEAQLKGLIDNNIPVFSLSPSSNGITNQYEREIQYPSKNKWFKEEIYKIGTLLPNNYITKFPKEFRSPSIVISASGMMDQGISSRLVSKLLNREDVEVFLVSYASPQTPAGKLKKGAKFIRNKYGKTEVLAKIHVFDIFSDHPDMNELLYWLSNQDSTTKLYLVHGDRDILKKAELVYKQKGFKNTKIAINGINNLN